MRLHQPALKHGTFYSRMAAVPLKALKVQARGSLEDTKKRIAESERRIDGKLAQFVDKKYW